jgi:DTW domain-containing protein YfiP
VENTKFRLPAEAGEVTRLVVLDATWRKSLKMLHLNPALMALPRLALQDLPPPRYRAMRRARRADQLSTLEAVCTALAQLEQDGARYQPMLDGFDRFIARWQARAAR